MKKKRINTKKKGQRKELLAQKELEKDDWRVVFRSYTIKMGPIYKGIDFADVFDVIAIKGIEWKFISVKHYGSAQTKYPEHQSKIRQFMVDHAICGMSFELWVWHKPMWRGRGKNKKWSEAHFEKIQI